MSRADTVTFVKRVFDDAALRDRVTEAGDAGVAGIAGELGLSVTLDEFQGVLDEVEQQLGERELSEADLDAVAGGGGFQSKWNSAVKTMSAMSRKVSSASRSIISNMR